MSSKCSSCGHEFPEITPSEFVAIPINDQGAVHQEATLKIKGSKKIWWLPVAAFLFVGGSFGGYMLYENHINQQVETWRIQGENSALQGDFDRAATLLATALKERPNHQTVIADLARVKRGQSLKEQLEKAQNSSQKGQFEQALAILSTVSDQLKDGQGAMYDLLKKQTKDQQSNVTIDQVKYQMKDKKTIEDLTPLLSKLQQFKVPQADLVTQDIKQKIATLAYNKANDFLKDKRFSEATDAVQQGLSYVANDSKLLSFKDTISKQQSDFEKAEEQRIQDAMITAAKDDEMNRTKAVKVDGVKIGTNASGDLVVQGDVKNVGTRPISMIEVFYTIYDSNGMTLQQSESYVTPWSLAPGQTGTFQDTQYGVFSGAKVTVTNTTWYLQ